MWGRSEQLLLLMGLFIKMNDPQVRKITMDSGLLLSKHLMIDMKSSSYKFQQFFATFRSFNDSHSGIWWQVQATLPIWFIFFERVQATIPIWFIFFVIIICISLTAFKSNFHLWSHSKSNHCLSSCVAHNLVLFAHKKAVVSFRPKYICNWYVFF